MTIDLIFEWIGIGFIGYALGKLIEKIITKKEEKKK